MGEWKAQLSMRVSQDFRREFEAWAEKERRKPSNMGCELLVWAFEQLKVAGSLTRLLKFQLGKKTKISNGKDGSRDANHMKPQSS